MEGWSSVMQKIIKATLERRLIDHKLVYCDTFLFLLKPR